MVSRATIKELLLGVHRYLGVAGCLLFLAWFLSGLVMMYVEMPYLPRTDQRLDRHAPLHADGPLLGPAAALSEAGVGAKPRRLFLDMHDGAAVWRVLPQRGRMVTLAADSGRVLGPWGPESAQLIAQNRGGWDGDLRYDRTVEVDQWTVAAGLFDPHRPLHRFRADGPSATSVYVSEPTGMVVQTTTRRQRILAYLGPVTHWIYPTFLRRHGTLWANLVISLSALGVVVVVAGLVLGLWNLRRPAAGLRLSPYRNRWTRWHHLFGLGFGLVTLAWIFSGLLSMGPFGLAPPTSATEEEALHVSGLPDWSAFMVAPAAAIEALTSNLEVKELEARFFSGRPYWLAWETPRRSVLLAADDSTASPMSEIAESDLKPAVADLVPGASISNWARLEEYDAYYYSKESFESRKRLPVYRAVFDDKKKTSVYLDPHTGTVALRIEASNRIQRYLYRGLHSWDFFGFFNRRPWWDLVVGFFLLGGAFGALTSAVLGARWTLRATRGPRIP